MWPFKKHEKTISKCFFCGIHLTEEDQYTLEYTASDGNGSISMCPMCAGMMEDMSSQIRNVYDE